MGQELRIAKLLHPVKAVVDRVINAIPSAETDIDNRDRQMIEKCREVRARAKVAHLGKEAVAYNSRSLRRAPTPLAFESQTGSARTVARAGPGRSMRFRPGRPERFAIARIGDCFRGVEHELAQ